ncbi:type VI secretion system baseplate subunit TssE [Massilia endophytica]|uniref:type VI secretion system baseplate subunit TssE n=1 Tax=Massilia endophytica TaxID=2899220 RepID=UPI001E5E7EFA|nr:type VI secretion system baseplate subunit TssE [Massilia endophytica]UGQ44827.1 type VI secretion system baseplate subunit TssE [Massilia endophytica]
MAYLSTGLFDRLLGEQANGRQLTAEQYKDAVMRDLEDLLNTRVAIPARCFEGYPRCAASLLNYGVPDFAGLSMSSSEDRALVCNTLRLAIERHEPRLRCVQARVAEMPGAVNRIHFLITGVLQGQGISETVGFNAVLQPSTLRYSIKRGAKS